MRNIALKLASALALVLTLAFIACGGSKNKGSDPVPVTAVTLSRDALSLTYPGAAGSLTATIAPGNATNKDVTWTTAPTGVVSVAGGLTATVTPVSVGTATITVASVADPTKTATCVVTVAPGQVPVEGVSLAALSQLLTFPGPNATLTATVTPADATNRRVTWSVAPVGVVGVAGSGTNNLTATVTPLSVGEATITVASAADPTKTARLDVTVALGIVPVTGVTVIPNEISMVIGGAPVSLVATVTPSDAANKEVTWSALPAGVVSVVGSGANNLTATVTPLTFGTATITVASVADPTKTATCSARVVDPNAPAIYVALGPGDPYGLYVNGAQYAPIGDKILNDVFVDDLGTIHAVGGVGSPGVYYSNGLTTALQPTHGGTTEGYCITVSGGDVYVAGYENAAGAARARLWKNGVAVTLNGVVESGSSRSVAHVVTLDSSGSVYVGGWSGEIDTRRRPVIWKDGTKHMDTGAVDFFINDMTVADDGVITVTRGYTNVWDWTIPQYTAWTIQPDMTTCERIQTTDMSADSTVRLFRHGADIYFAGYNVADPHYWKNGERMNLPLRADSDAADARDIFVHPDGTLYIYGIYQHVVTRRYVPEVWINGALMGETDPRRITSFEYNPENWASGLFVK